jgi:amino acid permease
MSLKKQGTERDHEMGSPSSSSAPSNPPAPSKKVGMANIIFNLANTTMGSGALAIPWCLRLLGLVGGSFCLVLSGMLCGISSYLFTRAGDELQQTSYVGVASVLYGKRGERTIMIMLLLLLQAPLIVYEMVLGNYFAAFLPKGSITAQSGSLLCMVAVSAAVIWPLSCTKRLSALGRVSFLSVVCIAFIALVITLEYAFNTSPELNSLRNIQLFPKATSALNLLLRFNALPSTIFCFINHVSILDIFAELSSPSIRRKQAAIVSTNIVSGAVYACIGVFGYLTFGETLPDNILLVGDRVVHFQTLFRVAMFMMGVVVTLSLPLFVYPARQCILWICDDLAASHSSFANAWKKVPEKLKAPTASFLVLVITIFQASEVRGIGVILSFFASILGSFIILIFPGWFFVKSVASKARSSGETVSAWLVISVGVLVLVGGTALSVLMMWYPNELAPVAIK